MARLKETAALTAMITTYNHESNTPLAVAIACLHAPDIKAAPSREKLEKALWRVADIVKKIKNITEQKEIEYQDCSDSCKMVTVKLILHQPDAKSPEQLVKFGNCQASKALLKVTFL